MSIKNLVINSMIAVIYIILVFVFNFLSFELIQFRVAEFLLILFIFNKKTSYGLLLGTFFANYFLSPFGLIDALFGTLATAFALVLIYLIKINFLKFLAPSIANGLIIGLMLNYLLELPFLETFFWIFLGELVVMYLIGYPIYIILKKNSHFNSIINF